jgi:hypothetical protein
VLETVDVFDIDADDVAVDETVTDAEVDSLVAAEDVAEDVTEEVPLEVAVFDADDDTVLLKVLVAVDDSVLETVLDGEVTSQRYVALDQSPVSWYSISRFRLEAKISHDPPSPVSRTDIAALVESQAIV